MTVSDYKIGIDFHGVITVSPSFFRDFSRLVFEKGGEVYIISGGPYTVVKNFLDSWKIPYSEIFSLVDYFAGRGEITYFANGNFKVPDELWNKAKAQYCRQKGIAVQIDDTPAYGNFFSGPFCLFDAQSRSGEIGGRKIDFSSSPQQTWQEIENFLTQKN